MGMRVGLGIACAVVVLLMSACGSPGGEMETQIAMPVPLASAAATATDQPTPTEFATLTPTPTLIPAATVTPEITSIYQQDLDLKGNIGSVEVDFLWIKYGRSSSYRIKIYKNNQSRALLWESEDLDVFIPMGYAEATEINGEPWIITYWGFGAHSIQAYPILWDGTTFRLVASYGLDNQPAFITCDGGVMHFSQDGYITAFFRPNQAPHRPKADVDVWKLSSDQYLRQN